MLQVLYIIFFTTLLYAILNSLRKVDKIESNYILTQNNKSILLHIDTKHIVLMPYNGLILYKTTGLFTVNYHSLCNEKDSINKDTKKVFVFKSIKDIENIIKDYEEDENLLNFIKTSYKEFIINKHNLN